MFREEEGDANADQRYVKLGREHRLDMDSGKIENAFGKGDSSELQHLPVFTIHGTDFLVDVTSRCLLERENPCNHIEFSSMRYVDNSYQLTYYPASKNTVKNWDVTDYISVVVPSLIELDPIGMAALYGKSVEELTGKTDFEVMVDLNAFYERLNGKLPVLQIEGDQFIVDSSERRLLPSDRGRGGISYDELKVFYDPDKGIHMAPYHINRRELSQLVDFKSYEAVADVIVVSIPSLFDLDPIGMNLMWNREPECDLMEYGLRLLHVAGKCSAEDIRSLYPGPERSKNAHKDDGMVIEEYGIDREFKNNNDKENRGNFLTKKRSEMKEENFNYLVDQIKYTGFGEGLSDELRSMMQKGRESFSLNYSKQYGNDKADAVLNFRMSEKGYYFFNNYEVALKQGHRDTPVKQTFFVVNDKLERSEGETKTSPTISFKEAFNLLSGRAINKDVPALEKRELAGKTRYVPTGKTYNAWIQLDFGITESNGNFKQKQFSQAYGFDLEAALGRYDIREMKQDKERGELLSALKKGNHTPVTFILSDGTEKKGFVEAAPQYKSVNTYDEHHKRIRQLETSSEKKSESQQQEKTRGKGTADEEGPKRQRRPRKGMNAA